VHTQVPSIVVYTGRPRVDVNGFSIEAACTVHELYAVLGKPTRIDTGETPAPYGHRNNELHVYDGLGVRLNEHHYTRLVQEICCSFETQEPLFRFTPTEAFRGLLSFDGQAMPLGGPERTFLRASPYRFSEVLACHWAFAFGRFGIDLCTRGDKLPSGLRSKSRRIVEVSVSFPHDPRTTVASSSRRDAARSNL
jgi:hypothetical protein